MQIPTRPPVPPGFNPQRFNFLHFSVLCGPILGIVLLMLPSKWWTRIFEIVFPALPHAP